MIRVADFIVEKLHASGVNHLFMVAGWGALYLTDAVARPDGPIGISVHHEQSGAYAAVAYAQYTGRLGACLVSMGCGSTNTLSGVLSAWQDGIPCVFLSGQNMRQETSQYSGIPLRTWGQQEADVIALVKPITKYATMLTDPHRVVFEVEKALYFAQEGRKGPVWLDVPLDIQNARIDPDACEHFYSEPVSTAPSAADVALVHEALRSARRPVVLIGGGIRSADACDAFAAFADAASVPVVNASSATDVFFSELAMGTVGAYGASRAANFAMQNADLLLVLGCRLSPMTTGPDYHTFAREAKVIVVDIDAVEHSKNTVRIDHFIKADVKHFLEALSEESNTIVPLEWKQKCLHWKVLFRPCENRHRTAEKVDLYYLAECLGRILPEHAVLLCDAGLEELILPGNVHLRNKQRCIHSVSQGAMGFALPAAIGAYFASGYPVVPVIGDGSIMMNLQELATIRYHNIPLKILVISNNMYAIIRNRQTELFRKRTIGTDPSNGIACPNFEKVAYAFDIPYMRIPSSEHLQEGLIQLMNTAGPLLCEIEAVTEQELVSIAYAKTVGNRLVRRPLEDQKPFLNREIFLSEMIINPVDQ